jgi:hypothetical protein
MPKIIVRGRNTGGMSRGTAERSGGFAVARTLACAQDAQNRLTFHLKIGIGPDFLPAHLSGCNELSRGITRFQDEVGGRCSTGPRCSLD